MIILSPPKFSQFASLESSNGGTLYHEAQESKLCAVHYTNIGFFSVFDLAAFASDFDRTSVRSFSPHSPLLISNHIMSPSTVISTSVDETGIILRGSAVESNAFTQSHTLVPYCELRTSTRLYQMNWNLCFIVSFSNPGIFEANEGATWKCQCAKHAEYAVVKS